jgi:hypothetical protein
MPARVKRLGRPDNLDENEIGGGNGRLSGQVSTCSNAYPMARAGQRPGCGSEGPLLTVTPDTTAGTMVGQSGTPDSAAQKRKASNKDDTGCVTSAAGQQGSDGKSNAAQVTRDWPGLSSSAGGAPLAAATLRLDAQREMADADATPDGVGTHIRLNAKLLAADGIDWAMYNLQCDHGGQLFGRDVLAERGNCSHGRRIEPARCLQADWLRWIALLHGLGHGP